MTHFNLKIVGNNHRRLKILAAQRGLNMTEIINNLIILELNRSEGLDENEVVEDVQCKH